MIIQKTNLVVNNKSSYVVYQKKKEKKKKKRERYLGHLYEQCRLKSKSKPTIYNW